MIKFIFVIVVILIILSLIGGAIEFSSTDDSWLFTANKEAVMSSVQNGAIIVYDFFKNLISSADLST